MIIAAALIEGVTFFALIIILLQVLFAGWRPQRRPGPAERTLIARAVVS